MSDIAARHFMTVRAGDIYSMRDVKHSRVHHDQMTFYYDLTGLNVSQAEFLNFVCLAWDVEPDHVTVRAWGAPDIFRADVG